MRYGFVSKSWSKEVPKETSKEVSRESNHKNSNKLVYVVLGVITTIFTGVTISMWFQVNSSISDIREDVKAVCVMQDNQEKMMIEQKELLQELIGNHVIHLKEVIEYLREDIRDVKEHMNKDRK